MQKGVDCMNPLNEAMIREIVEKVVRETLVSKQEDFV